MDKGNSKFQGYGKKSKPVGTTKGHQETDEEKGKEKGEEKKILDSKNENTKKENPNKEEDDASCETDDVPKVSEAPSVTKKDLKAASNGTALKQIKKVDDKDVDFSVLSGGPSNPAIEELERVLVLYRAKMASQESAGLLNHDEALKQHQQMQEVNKITYDKLKGIAATGGPTLDFKAQREIMAKPFHDSVGFEILKVIPSLFSIESVHMSEGAEASTSVRFPPNCPKYLPASQKAFQWGVTEARFVMKSVGYKHSIEFNPGGGPSTLSKTVLNPVSGPVRVESSKMDYVLNLFETAFKICLGSQFILTGIPFMTVHDRGSFAGDLVTTNQMLQIKYVDQDVPLLPCGAYGHAARYLYEKLNEMFSPAHHTMKIGQVANDSFSRSKIFSRVAVITDQYTAALNERFLAYLFSRSIDVESYQAQHEALTLPFCTIKFDNPGLFEYSIVPIWRREECDGVLLMYALGTERQKQYLHHLTLLLQSVGLVSFASITEVANLPPRKGLQDAIISELLDRVLTSVPDDDFFLALACDLSTTWIDTELVMSALRTTPADHLFRVFTIVLWYMYYPSIARDNTATLMYHLFISLEVLAAEETLTYCSNVGFSSNPGMKGMIKLYAKEDFLSGEITFQLIKTTPDSKYPIFNELHRLLTHSNGKMEKTRDSALIHTPRMSDRRKYYQPNDFIRACSNTMTDGEVRNTFGNHLNLLIRFMLKLISTYRASFKDSASRTVYGCTPVDAAQLINYFKSYVPSTLSVIGIRSHTEMFVLRALGANSPYVLDCQNLSLSDYKMRPQVVFESEDGRWDPIVMQRHSERLPFELPFKLFLTLRGAMSADSIKPPNTVQQFSNLLDLQHEGIICGDLIRFVNNLKFGSVGLFNREALGVSNLVTASRAATIFEQLSRLVALEGLQDVFRILIDKVAHQIDSRAIGFKIILQPYNSLVYIQEHAQPAHSLYNHVLRLGRDLLDDQMRIVSPLFVPETSPIALYTNGLIVQKSYVEDLDPFASINVSQHFASYDRVLLWSTNLVGRRAKSNIRMVDEEILQIPNTNGEIDEFVLNDGCPKLLFIVNAKTGQITHQDYAVLSPYILEGKISLFFPELMVIMNREILSQNVTMEAYCMEQLMEITCGAPNRRVILTFGDTVSRPYRMVTTVQKQKFLFPIGPVNQKDIIMRGVDDLVQPSNSLYLGSWLGWAHGAADGKSLIVHSNEAYRNQQGEVVRNGYGTERVINKLELGMVNMNNNVRILEREDWIKLPQPIQSSEGVVSNIYVET